MIVSYVLPYASGSDLPHLQVQEQQQQQQQQHASPGRRSLALDEGANAVNHQDPDVNLLQDLSGKDEGALDDLVTELQEQVSVQVSPHNLFGTPVPSVRLSSLLPFVLALSGNTRHSGIWVPGA